MPSAPKLDKPVSTTRRQVAEAVDRLATRVDRHVAIRLRERREQLGLTVQDFARRVGLTAAQLQKYETGHTSITAGRLLVFAEALECDPEYFFDSFANEPSA